MKILGNINTNGLLVQLSTDELARLLGYYSSGNMEQNLGRECMHPGKEYDITQRLGYVADLEKMGDTVAEFEKLVTRLKSNAPSLKTLTP